MMKLLVLFLLLVSMTYAETTRPKIGLVLSGGGARGGAHLGVIKMFEKYYIPIDMIAGTSMGSLVGGLYASGKTSDEIEKLLTETSWEDYISVSYERAKIPFRRKQFDRDFPGRLRIGLNSEDEPTFQAGLFSAQQMLKLLKRETLHVNNIKNFSDFPIPYVAVASNLQNGEMVVLESGDFSKSIYASIAIPGGFEPIEIDGKVLVDGGIAANLPLEAMRDMGADIIVAVDISTPFAKDIDSESYLTVISQLSDILMRKNVEKDIASMRDNEILITPDLKGYTPLDSNKYPEIIAIGEQSVESIYHSNLSHLSVSESEYKRYKKSSRYQPSFDYGTIDAININNSTYISNKFIMKKLDVKNGDDFNVTRVESGIDRLFNTEIFSEILYDIESKDGNSILHVNADPSWNQNGIIKAGISFEDNFKGENDFDLRFEATLYGLNSYGAEWRNRFSIGSEELIYTEWYQPIDMMQKYYFKPYFFYRDRNVYTSATAVGVEGSDEDVLDIEVKESGAALAFGANLTNSFQVEATIAAKKNESIYDTLAIDAETMQVEYVRFKNKDDSRSLNFKMVYDSYDNAFFPKYGYYSYVKWSKEFDSLGGDLDFEQIDTSFNAAYSFGKHTFLPKLEYATTYNGESDFTSLLTLGGFAKLSGYANNALSGDTRLLGVLNYRYQISNNNFFGALSAPLYVGGMVEMGNVWFHDEQNTPSMISAANIYLASDTILGPFYFAYGLSKGGRDSLYFYLGHAF